MAFMSSYSMNKAVGASGNVYGPMPDLSGPNVGNFDMGYRGSRGATGAGLAGMNARLGQSMMGRAVQQGALESFGWQFQNGKNYGFMGKVPTQQSGLSSKAQMNNAIKNIYKQPGPKPGILAKAGSLGMRAIGGLSTAYFAYEGYQEEGVWGAAKGIAESVAYSSAFNYAAAAVGSTMGGLAMGAAAIGIGTYALGEAGRAHAKSLRQMEMGGGDQMMQAVTSAGAATARQRSLNALNNSHLSPRSAMGNEGFLMHRTFA